MSTLNVNAKRLLDEGTQNLVQVGILDEKLLLTSTGKEYLFDILFWKHRGELEQIAKKELNATEADEEVE